MRHTTTRPTFYHPFQFRRRSSVPSPALITLLVLLTFLIQGYHPLAEDGGLYVAGIQFALDPTLFPHYTNFVTEHLRFSIFAPVLASIVRVSHLPLPWILLLTYIASLWLTFYAAHKILQRTFARNAATLAGLCLLGAFWTLPIAGTSLLLMDPYVTGRSLSTPLSLSAIASALAPQGSLRPHLYSTLCLIAAALFHPLMAAYAFAFLIVLHLTRLRQRRFAWIVLALSALALAAAIRLIAPGESSALIAAEQSRYYWFLSQWQWFELLGLAGPVGVLALLLLHFRKRSDVPSTYAADLCRANIVIGCIAIVVVLFFAPQSASTHLVARLQPLRVFLLIYAIMTLLLGATATQLALDASARSRITRRVLAVLLVTIIVALNATMFLVQRHTFPASRHLELPWLSVRNPWSQAFIWVRDHTPQNALFALDTKYVNEAGEDAQTFRATALRSALPDFSKDGGEAAITPPLAEQWQQGSAAQTNLSAESDAVRNARLLPFHVTWMVLHSSANTAHPCPYDNGTVKVCRLTP